jgi:dihydropteroate synthase
VKQFTPFSLNIRGTLRQFNSPAVMGILNVTPDSFYAASRHPDNASIESHVKAMVADGVDIIDIGGYSSRPGADQVSPREETGRLLKGIEACRRIAPEIPLSVDTFRADVARAAIEAGADIINDIAGGDLDPGMFDTVAALKVPYILMHMRGTPETMSRLTDYPNGVTADVIADLSHKLNRLALLGVNDVIIDPGFGFSKTVEQNYGMLARLDAFAVLGRPVLAGMSRKSMLYRPLGITADRALNATTAVNVLALTSGAAILRVHDVEAAAQAVKIVNLTREALANG